MKKKLVVSVMLSGCLALSMPAAVFAEEDQATASSETLSDDLYDFQLQIQGDTYQFPMTYADFTALGWELSSREDPEMKFSSNSYGFVYFNKGELSVNVDMLNLGVNECSLEDCLVAGITIDEGYGDVDWDAWNVVAPCGIAMGTANVDDIKAAYGTPSDTYESDLYTKLTYEKDIYEEIEFYVYTDGDNLRQMSLRNFVEPEGYDKGTVSGEVPEIVTSYQVPEALGTDMLDPVVEFCGDLYRLPCPVTALEENGWKMQGVSDEDFVSGGSMGFIDVMRENQSIHLSVYNMTENAVTVENCFVTELQAATYDNEAITIKVSGDITLGAEKADLIAAAEEKGYVYEDGDSYLTIYKNKDSKLDTYLEIWFDKDESETAAASVTFRNEILE